MCPTTTLEQGAAAAAGMSINAQGNTGDGCWSDSINTETCMFCSKADYQQGFGPRLLVTCSCCNVKSFHVECLEQQQSVKLDDSILLPEAVVLCSEGCKQLHDRWAAKSGCRIPVKGESSAYTIEIVKYKAGDRASTVAVDHALKIFRTYFKKSIMGNGRDLLEMVCQAYETPQEEIDAITEKQAAKDAAKEAARAAGGGSQSDNEDEDEDDEIHNFGGFRVLVLRKGAVIVTVATVRLYGPHFAEMPFVATRQDYRREGNCRRLVKGVEDILESLRVQYLVLPSMNEVLPMWLNKFGFEMLTKHEHEKLLECNIVDMDQETAHLVKKRVGAPTPPPSAPGSRTTRGGAKRGPISQAPSVCGSKRSKLSSSWGQRLVKGVGRGRGRAGSKGGGSDESSSSSSSEDESEEEEVSDAAEELGQEAEEASGSDGEEVVLEEEGKGEGVVPPARKRRAPAAPRARASTPPNDCSGVRTASVACKPPVAPPRPPGPAGVAAAGGSGSPPKRYKITMEDKRRMDAERLGIPYVPGKPLVYPFPMPPPRPFVPAPPLPEPVNRPAGRARAGARAQPRRAAPQPHSVQGVAKGAHAKARKPSRRIRRRAYRQRAVRMRVKLAARARASVRRDAVLALTLAEAVAASVAEKQRAAQLQQELCISQMQAAQLAAREQQLAALLKQFGVRPPPPSAAISHIIAAPMFIAPAAPGSMTWGMPASVAAGSLTAAPPSAVAAAAPAPTRVTSLCDADTEQDVWLLDVDVDREVDAGASAARAPETSPPPTDLAGDAQAAAAAMAAAAVAAVVAAGAAAQLSVVQVPPVSQGAVSNTAGPALSVDNEHHNVIGAAVSPTSQTIPAQPLPAPACEAAVLPGHATSSADVQLPEVGTLQGISAPVPCLQAVEVQEPSPYDLLLQSTIHATPQATATPFAATSLLHTAGTGVARTSDAAANTAPTPETAVCVPDVEFKSQEQPENVPPTEAATVATVSPPAGAGAVAGVSPPAAATPFATPRTLRAFDEQCLGRLLPRVLNDLLAPSPLPPQQLTCMARAPEPQPQAQLRAAPMVTAAPDAPLTEASPAHVSGSSDALPSGAAAAEVAAGSSPPLTSGGALDASDGLSTRGVLPVLLPATSDGGPGPSNPRSRPPIHAPAARMARSQVQGGFGGSVGPQRSPSTGGGVTTLSLFAEVLSEGGPGADLGRCTGSGVCWGQRMGDENASDSDSPEKSLPQRRSIYRAGSGSSGQQGHRRAHSFARNEFEFSVEEEEEEEGLGAQLGGGAGASPSLMNGAGSRGQQTSAGTTRGSGLIAAGSFLEQAAAGHAAVLQAPRAGVNLLRGHRGRGQGQGEVAWAEAAAAGGSWSQLATASWGGLYGGAQGPMPPAPHEPAAPDTLIADPPSPPVQRPPFAAALAADTPAPHMHAAALDVLPPTLAHVPHVSTHASLLGAGLAGLSPGMPLPLLPAAGPMPMGAAGGGGSTGTMQPWRTNRRSQPQGRTTTEDCGSGSQSDTCSTQRAQVRMSDNAALTIGPSVSNLIRHGEAARSATPLVDALLSAAGGPGSGGSAGSGGSTGDEEDEGERVRLALAAISSFY